MTIETKTFIIDADSHIEDHPAIWDYLEPEYAHRKPLAVNVGELITHNTSRNYVWMIDGEMFPKLMGYGASCHGSPPVTDFAKAKPINVESQAITDVNERLKSMDAVKLDVSVIYSTLFLQPLTNDLMYEAALMRAFNSFMADACAKAPDRLKWVAPVPMRHPEEAIKEMRRVKELGAVGVMILGTAGDVLLHDRRFDPFYAEAEKLGMPVTVHVGWAHTGLHKSCESAGTAMILAFELSMVMGFYSFVGGGILDRFPDLKVGFIEGGADWFPSLLNRMEHWYDTPTAQPWQAKKRPLEYIRDHQLYFTCEGDEKDLPRFLEIVGADRVLGSADFPHVHFEGGKLGETFDEIRERDDITQEAKDLMYGPNAIKFYGLEI